MTSIRFNCPHCAQSLDADADMAGTTLDCPACSKNITVPQPTPRMSELEQPPTRQPEPVLPTVPVSIPLAPAFAWSRLKPMLVYCLLFGWASTWVLPNRFFIEAPLLPVLILAVPSIMLAVLTSSYFIRPFRFPRGQAFGALLFTMFIGLFVLLLFQSIANHSLRAPLRNYGKGTGLLVIVKAIGWAYEWTNADNLVQQFFGYIAGVGLCEEATKLLPLFYLVLRKPRHTTLDYRSFLLVGFYSGLGFGIGEAFYGYAPWSQNPNLLTDGNVIRWFACVPSHAVYAVIDAAFLWMLAPVIKKTVGFYRRLGLCALATLAVAVLHGIYDVAASSSRDEYHIISIVLDGLSLALMYVVVRTVAKHTNQTDEVTSTEQGKARGVVAWVRGVEIGKRRFMPQFILAAAMILASLIFSASEATVQRMIQYYQNQQQMGGGGIGLTPSRCNNCWGTGTLYDAYGGQMRCQMCGGSGVIRR